MGLLIRLLPSTSVNNCFNQKENNSWKKKNPHRPMRHATYVKPFYIFVPMINLSSSSADLRNRVVLQRRRSLRRFSTLKTSILGHENRCSQDRLAHYTAHQLACGLIFAKLATSATFLPSVRTTEKLLRHVKKPRCKRRRSNGLALKN